MENLTPGSLSKDPGNRFGPNWQELLQLLKNGQYDRAEAIFAHLQSGAKHPDHQDIQIMLAAAGLICLTCVQLQSQEEWYRCAYQNTLKSEHELQQMLCEFCKQLMEWNTAHPQTLPQTSPSNPRKNSLVNLIDLPVLKQHLQKFLGANSGLMPFLGLAQAVNRLPVAEVKIVPGLQEETPLFEEERPPQAEFEAQTPFPTSLSVFCLGKFQVYIDGHQVNNWPSSKGKSIFKYLITHREQAVPREVLMDIFWPNASPESARRNLNWAIHSLRQVLHKNQPNYSHVLFQDDCYRLNADLKIWTDIDEFLAHFRKALMLDERQETDLAIHEYHAAEVLYQGEVLEEDRYEDWLLALRQSMQTDYLNLLDRLCVNYYNQTNCDECVRLCLKILATDPCQEQAHLCLMQCYYRQGYPYLSIRQYYMCVEKLKAELDLPPSQQTIALFDAIRLGKCDLSLV